MDCCCFKVLVAEESCIQEAQHATTKLQPSTRAELFRAATQLIWTKTNCWFSPSWAEPAKQINGRQMLLGINESKQQGPDPSPNANPSPNLTLARALALTLTLTLHHRVARPTG